MVRKGFYVVVFILASLVTYPQVVINNSTCKKAYSLILSLRFEEADSLIRLEKKANPNNLFTEYLYAQIYFLKATISEDETLFDEYDGVFSNIISKIEELPDSCSYKDYFLGNINLQLATLNLRFRNYATGLWQINRSYRYLQNNQQNFPDFFPNEITLGVLHILIGIVPESYEWILRLVRMSGTVQQGRMELKEALEKCENSSHFSFLVEEVLFYITMTDMSLSADPGFATYVLSKTKPKARDNLLMAYLTMNIYMKTGSNDSALSVVDNINYSHNFYPFYYLNYLKGECYLRKLQTDEAINNYRLFTDNFTGSNYLKDAYLKIGLCRLIEGDTAGYNNSIQLINMVGKTDIDADIVAQSIYDEKPIQNISLIKARLLFDGGYYFAADSVLKHMNASNLTKEELVERNYRKARIFDNLHENEYAIGLYKLTIEEGQDLSLYYAGNSALKLGNIYEKQLDTNSALLYYKKCLSLEFNQYKNSIKGKAKQGIKRLSTR